MTLQDEIAAFTRIAICLMEQAGLLSNLEECVEISETHLIKIILATFLGLVRLAVIIGLVRLLLI